MAGMEKRIIDRGHYTESLVAENAIRIVEGASKQLLLVPTSSMNFVLEAGSNLEICLVMLPETDQDVTVSIDFVGEGASASLSGLYICRESNVSIKVEVRHRVGGCVSRQLFNGIVAGSAKAAFDGRIIVAPDAKGSKAFQENHNLLLGAEAWADTRPQLEIYNDDVECSHGATIGRLNEDEQFYMRSRGVPEEEAKVLQMISFLAPVLSSVPEVNRESLMEKIETAVRSL